MNLDIRLPIGMLFFILGSLLTLFGLWSDRAMYARSLGYNVNVIWGLVLVVFGAIMAYFGRRGAAARPAPAAEGAPAGSPRHGH